MHQKNSLLNSNANKLTVQCAQILALFCIPPSFFTPKYQDNELKEMQYKDQNIKITMLSNIFIFLMYLKFSKI